MNLETDAQFTEYRAWVTGEPIVVQAIPLILMIFLENKISRHYILGSSHKLMTHALTVMLMANFIVAYQRPAAPEEMTKEYLEQQLEHAQLMALIGNVIWITVIGFCIASTVYFKIMLGKTWDNASVRCGFFIAKAAILTAGNVGPLLYFCMLLQWYNIALVINHRRDSIPGKSFPIQVFLAWFTMQQYFLRSNHRDRIDSVNYGKVCPGQIDCGMIMHWTLVFFEILAPYIIGLSLLPLIVKARVQHAYAHLKKHDESESPAQ